MTVKSFILAKKADKELSRLPTKIQTKIIKAFDTINHNPLSGIKLHGELGNYYKFRVGDYRIIYLFDPKTSLVSVLKIEHRQGVYK